jgi:hypothetical protein
VTLAAAACSSPPAPEGSANAAAPAAVPVSGSLDDWHDAVCRDDVETASGTLHTVDGSACVPKDGDGIVNFDRFDSASSMDSALSWTVSPYVAKTVVDGKPMAIWTPSGEATDLDPLTGFGFRVASFTSAPLALPSGDPPGTAPTGDVVTIPPNQYGYVVVQTAAADTQCIVETTFVGCQTAGQNWAQHADGSGAYHGVRINTDGTGSWVDGNLGAAAPTTLADRTYRAQGWTIVTTAAGMRFTNDSTGHGAVVSVERVQPF